jgi:hypothetical protein
MTGPREHLAPPIPMTKEQKFFFDLRDRSAGRSGGSTQGSHLTTV